MIGYTRATFMLALSAVVVALVAPAGAQTWPSRPIKLIVPHAPGGVTDVVARLVAQPLGEALGQSVIVENKPGASGLVGTESAASAAPDGYTFVMFVDANTILPSTVKQLNHDPLKSFAPITVLGRGSHVIVAHPSLGVRTLPELVAYAKKNPGTMSYASPGIGSPQNLSMETIKNATGIDLTHIPYKGGGQAIGDVVSGQVKVGVLGMAPALPYIKSGKLMALAVTGAARVALLPDVPTVAESAVPGFETAQWQGISAPAGTPPAVIKRMHDELVRIMSTPQVIERLAAIGMDNSTSPTPDDFSKMIAAELQRWPAAVKLAGIQPE
ncbi:MAG TPA: tripartite tricarboxylate transporter substrate binding protein [Reyranella sp.]|nr:tripartite tricarboxylate transporter substrate binding protein [Reyranella sp.]